MSHFDWKLLRRKKVIPAERRVHASGKENETWTLAPSASSDQANLNSTIKPTIVDESKVCDESLNTTELMKSSSNNNNNIDDNINDEPVVLDDHLMVETVEINRDNENRKSRAKKVKNYLRKCKGALSSSSARDDSTQCRQSGRNGGGKRTTSNDGGGRRSNRRPASSSWYLDDGTGLNTTNDTGAVIPITNVTAAAVKDINERMSDDVLPVRTTSLTRDYDYKATPPTSTRRFGSESLLDSPDRYVDNDTVDLKLNHDIDIDACEKMKNIIQIKNDDGEILINDDDDDKNKLLTGYHLLSGGRGDVASLVRNLLGPIYGENVLDLLTRQARDILVCAYHGNLEMFVELYLSPASKLLAKVKHLVSETVDECVVPNGWPLTLGGTGLVLQLGELETSALRHGECYLCVRNSRQSGGDDATTTNTTTTTTSVIINNESTTENSERQLERIIDIVEIALVWRSSMRVPGILHWEREDDFMDWRELKEHNQTNTTSVTNTSTRRRRRKSRDELSPSAAIASSSSSSSSLSNQRLRTDVISPLRINTIANDVCVNNADKENVILPVTMRFDQRQTNRHHQKDVASRLNIDNLKNPSCLLSIINNQLNNETSSSSLSSSSVIDLPDELNHDELTNLISTLLVTVERKIERVNLDDLIFPCPGCRNIDTDNSLLGCTCTLPSESDELINNRHNSDTCDCGMNNENLKSFEIDGIKHIDSDDEEEVRMDFGVKRKDDEISSPRSVHEFSDEVINCGLRLPGI
ncbi:hypothetical protein PV327_003372 [Microctonus hyperodae]|uniref:Uncharacterized protein n=1 Tax=Microctonus hyperodae TaxID=165561 RepID=A0AA39G5H2_MICHY|nr:hypothetical protein PV327_003372 [Microctonus hyperodae]